MLPRYRASDFTLEFVSERLVAAGALTEDSKRTAFARENAQRSRLLRAQINRGGNRALARAEISPIELLASFQFPDPRRKPEILDEDKIARTIAESVGVAYAKIDRLKLDGALITRLISRPYARKHAVIPLAEAAGILTVAFANPFDRACRTISGPGGRWVRPAGPGRYRWPACG